MIMISNNKQITLYLATGLSAAILIYSLDYLEIKLSQTILTMLCMLIGYTASLIGICLKKENECFSCLKQEGYNFLKMALAYGAGALIMTLYKFISAKIPTLLLFIVFFAITYIVLEAFLNWYSSKI